MRKAALVFTLVALTAVLAQCSPAPGPLPELPEGMTYAVYFPLFPHQPYPECEQLEGVGIAWLDNSPTGIQQDLRNFCATMFYNASGNNFADLQPGEIPMIWGNSQQHQSAAESVPDDYCEKIVFLNEPGNDPNQFWAPQPEMAAAAYVQLRAMAPACAKPISPNIIIQGLTGTKSTAYLRGFILEVERLQGGKADLYAVGIHIYGAESVSATTKINWVRDEMASLGYDLPIWVTEYGVFNVGGVQAQMTNMTYQIATHNSVEAFLGYTPRRSQNAVEWIDEEAWWPGTLSASGRGWFAGLAQAGLIGGTP
ncbi:MAG: hypothetical protein KDE34_12780 [Anaerolineales bacterium]|nr:hypothetical protein [Anaerolineales bacterium]